MFKCRICSTKKDVFMVACQSDGTVPNIKHSTTQKQW